MSIIKRFFNKFNNDEWDDWLTSNIDKLPKTSEYPISPYEAFKIAELRYNLKSDYVRNTYKFISYLDFTDCTYELVDGDNGRKYWYLKITKCKFSLISTSEDLETTTFSDGMLGKDDLKKLQCLIDVNTGEYIYYPQIK